MNFKSKAQGLGLYMFQHFQWLRDQLTMVEDYAYAKTNFCGDPDLSLPEGFEWGDKVRRKFSLYDVFDILII
jgi:hypothetical protein